MRKELIKIFKTKEFVGDSFILKDKDVILNSIRIQKNNDGIIKEYVCFDIQVGGENEYQIVINDLPRAYLITYKCIIEGYKLEIAANDISKYGDKNSDYTIYFDSELKGGRIG